MTIIQQEFEQTMRLIDQVVSRMSELEKRAYDFGTGDVLYRSEIHTVQAIGDHPGLGVTELAEHMLVTKGAISQMIRKLVAKNLVRKEYAPGSSRNLRLYLTDRGQIARTGHEAVHRAMAELMRDHLGRNYKQRLRVFRDVFTQLDEILDQMEKKKSLPN